MLIDCVKSVAITPNNKYVITGAVDGVVRVFDLTMKQLVANLDGIHKASVMGIAVSSNSRFLVSASIDCSIVKWDLSLMKMACVNDRAHRGTLPSAYLGCNVNQSC